MSPEPEMISREEMRKRFRDLYEMLGLDEGKCRACGRKFWWLKSRYGTTMPYTEDGLTHFVDCPDSGSFRKKKGGEA